MKIYRKTFITGLAIFIALFSTASLVYALTKGSYGYGTYGADLYGGNTAVTSTPAPTGSSNNTAGSTLGSSSESKPPACNDQKPGSAPDLFQIDRKGKSAKLYFAPASDPYNKYYISYGVGTNTQDYGVEVELSKADGAIDYTINELNPATGYSFKVRAGNGCSPGDWSNPIGVNPLQTAAKVSFYKGNEVTIQNDASVSEAVPNNRNSKIANKKSPGKKTTPAKKNAVTPVKKSNKPTPAKSKNGVWNWFQSVFK